MVSSKVQRYLMILSSENLIIFALYLLNDHWDETQNHLLWWALMSWARFISQLKFQGFIMCRNHLYLLPLLLGKVLSSFAFSSCLASLQMSIWKQAYSLYLWASLPQSKSVLLSLDLIWMDLKWILVPYTQSSCIQSIPTSWPLFLFQIRSRNSKKWHILFYLCIPHISIIILFYDLISCSSVLHITFLLGFEVNINSL